VHQSNLILLVKLSPLDFWGIFFGPICEEFQGLTPYNPTAWWKDYYFSGSIGILGNAVMVGRREEIYDILRQPKLIQKPKTAAELTFQYLEMLLKRMLVEPPAPLMDFDYFIYTNCVVPANLEISHADYRAQVVNLTLGTRNVGFVKSYSNLNWFNFVKETEKKANLVILDPPYIQTYPDSASAQNILNTLAAINRGLDSELEPLTKENLCLRVLESALEASQVDAIFLIWCSLEQSLDYLHLYKGETLRERGLTGLTVCTINGKFSQAGSNQNQQIPVNQSEFFVVAKKGNPRQSTFIPWPSVDPEAVEPTSQSSHFSTKSKYWNQDANLYPYLKPRKVMRDLLHYYCTPGQLIFEGFAGSKSCVLGAIIKGANLVCIDNNPESASHLVRQYQRFQGDAAYFEQWNQSGSRPNPERNCSDWWKSGMHVPNLAFYGPDEWNETVPIENTEVTPFNSPPPSRTALGEGSSRGTTRVRSARPNVAEKRPRLSYSQVSDDVIQSTQMAGGIREPREEETEESASEEEATAEEVIQATLETAEDDSLSESEF
jgi:16S rRNA G966 N2-methylase RsmD